MPADIAARRGLEREWVHAALVFAIVLALYAATAPRSVIRQCRSG